MSILVLVRFKFIYELLFFLSNAMLSTFFIAIILITFQLTVISPNGLTSVIAPFLVVMEIWRVFDPVLVLLLKMVEKTAQVIVQEWCHVIWKVVQVSTIITFFVVLVYLFSLFIWFYRRTFKYCKQYKSFLLFLMDWKKPILLFSFRNFSSC